MNELQSTHPATRNPARLTFVPRGVLISAALVATLAGIAPSTARAQERAPAAPTRERLTLDRVAAIARANPPAVLVAIARQQAAQAQLALVRASYLPTLTGSSTAAVQVNNGSQVVGGTTISVSSQTGAVDGTLQFRWTIWDFGRTAANVAAARLGAAASLADLRSAERLAVTQATGAYYVLLADRELIASNQTTLEQREHELEISTGLVQAGVRPPIEQTRSQVSRDAAALDLTNAQTNALNDAASLAAALALDPALPVDVDPAPELRVDDDPTRAADAAVANRPEVVAARLALEQSEAQLRATRLAYLPVLSASGSASVRYTQRFDMNTGGPGESANAGVTLSVPIYDPTIRANVRIAEASVQSARAQYEQEVLNARTEAVQGAIAVRAAAQTLAQSVQLAAGAAANLAQAEGRYQAGAAPLLELVDAQAADATARVAVVRARLQLELAKVRLLGAVGRLGDLGGGGSGGGGT